MSSRVVIFTVIILLAAAGAILWQQTGSAPEPIENPLPVPQPETAQAEPTPPVTSRPVPPVPAPLDGLWGNVRAMNGAPIAGAEVMAYHPNLGGKRARSNAQGVYRFENLSEGSFQLSAKHPDYNRAVVDDVGPDDGPIDLILTERSAISGQVVDAVTNEPITNAEIAVLPVVPDDGRSWRSMLARTDLDWAMVGDNARFELQGIPSGETIGVAARSQNSGAAYVIVDPIEPGASAADVTIALSAPARIIGLVKNAQGTPISGAAIYVDEADQGAPAAHSDGEGRFEMTTTASDSILLNVVHSDYVTANKFVSTVSGQTTTADFVLDYGGWIDGYVYRGAEPQAGARLLVPNQSSEPQVRTNEEGYYVIKGVPVSSTQVMATLPSRDQDRRSDRMSLLRTVKLENGYASVDFVFTDERAEIEGYVSINDEPIRGVRVTGSVKSEFGELPFSAVTNPQGYYHAKQLFPGKVEAVARIELTNGEEIHKRREAQARSGEIIRLDFQIRTEAGVTVYFDNWKDGMHASVVLLPDDAYREPKTLEELSAMYEQAVVRQDVAAPEFEFAAVEAGAYVVMAIFMPDDPDGADLWSQVRFVTAEFRVEQGIPATVSLEAPAL